MFYEYNNVYPQIGNTNRLFYMYLQLRMAILDHLKYSKYFFMKYLFHICSEF